MATLHPGHGEPGAPDELITRQREYLAHFRDQVAQESPDGTLPPGAEQRIADAMGARYPGYVPVAAIPDLLARNAEPIAKELHHG